ncbi:hypothetical protein Srufu_074630 [Streptomyces libani subsp. rufus]|nr:hypothetical protein Srufu_074630 [Streptomyces libani subsp. rufus]
MALERGDGLTRGFLAPQLLDEQFRRHHPPQAYEEQGEQGPAAWRTEGEVAAVVARRHGAQNAQ